MSSNSPFVNRYLWDGTILQVPDMFTGDEKAKTYKLFYSIANKKYIQEELKKRGISQIPSFNKLEDFMNQIYANDMSQSLLDVYVNGRSLANLNETVINKIAFNISFMSNSRKLYLQDISTPRGVLQIDRPIDTNTRGKGPTIRLDYMLP